MSKLTQMLIRIPEQDKKDFELAIKRKHEGIKVSTSEVIRNLIHNYTERKHK